MWRAVASTRAVSSSAADFRISSGSSGTVNHFANFGRRILRAPIRVVHGEFAGAAENLVVHSEGRADGEAGVARGGLHVNALEGRTHRKSFRWRRN